MTERRQILLPFLLTSKSKHKISLLIAILKLSLNWAVNHWLRFYGKKMEGIGGNKKFSDKWREPVPISRIQKTRQLLISRIMEILFKEN